MAIGSRPSWSIAAGKLARASCGFRTKFRRRLTRSRFNPIAGNSSGSGARTECGPAEAKRRSYYAARRRTACTAAVPPQAPSVPSDAAIKEATKKLNAKVDQLQTELEKSRNQLGAAQKEKENLSDRLKQTNSKLETAQGELEKTKGAERQVREQLGKAQESLKKSQASSGDSGTKAQEALRAEINRLKDALIAAESGARDRGEREGRSNAKMTETNKRIVGIAQERDKALGAIERHEGSTTARRGARRRKLRFEDRSWPTRRKACAT